MIESNQLNVYNTHLAKIVLGKMIYRLNKLKIFLGIYMLSGYLESSLNPFDNR